MENLRRGSGGIQFGRGVRMAFKQPRVPQESGRLVEYVRNLGMFLRDFCMASWNADRLKDAEIEKIKKRLDALEGK
nr:MAG TPA: hypothetical protein [Caudoviricetes sp.]